MLKAVAEKLCTELADRGIDALTAWPNADMDRSCPQVALSLKNARVRGGGFGDYIGMDEIGERYGLMCQAKFELDVYSRPDGGFEALSGECDKLINALWDISGGAVELELGQFDYDRALCALHCRGTLDACFWLVKSGADAGEFTDFTVKGMILHGNE